MSKKNINLIFLVHTPLTHFTYGRYGINVLNRKNVNFKFLNILYLLNRKIYYDYTKKHKLKFDKNYKDIKSIKSLIFELKNIKGNFFYADFIGPISFLNIIINLLLRLKKGKKISVLHQNMATVSPLYKPSFLKLIYKIKTKSIFYIIRVIYKKFLNISYNLFCAKSKYIFVSNENLLKNLSNKFSKGLFKITSYSYYEYIQARDKKKSFKKNYFVFVDQEQEFSFDHKVNFANNPYINANEYFTKLEQLFKFLEQKMNTKVVIAGCPRRSKNFFFSKKRKVYYNKTPDLISNSRGVLCHDSLASNFAILFKKPIVFLTFNAFKIREGKHERIVELSKFLNSNLINIDSNLKNIDFLTFKKKLSKINLKKYNFYKKNFITFKKQTNSDHTYLGIIKSIEKYG